MPDLNYQDFYSTQINTLTLAQALQMHYRLNPQFTTWDKYRTVYARNLIKAHDISHVISGCDTSLAGEVLVQCWTLFSTKIPTENFRAYYRDPESQVLLKPVGKSKMVLEFLKNLGHIINLWKNSFKMHRKWRYFAEDEYMDVTVGKIRQGFGIVIL